MKSFPLFSSLVANLKSVRLLFGFSMIPFTIYATSPISEQPTGKVNYPANFQVANGIDLFLLGDYLYWGATEDGLYFAQKGSTAEGSLGKIDPSFDSGLRAVFGFSFPKAGYELSLLWTCFSTSWHNSLNTVNVPLWAEPGFASYATASSAYARWKLGLNLFDIECGRASWFGGNFSLRPFLGVRGALIDQSFSSAFNYNTSPASNAYTSTFLQFQGAGLRGGGEGRWTLPYDFSIFGLISGSLLYGTFDTKIKCKLDSSQIASSHDDFQQTLSSLQLLFGLAWDTHFASDRLHLEFHIGWEQNLFFHFNRLNHYLNQLPQGFLFEDKGNLGLQGLTVGGRFDF